MPGHYLDTEYDVLDRAAREAVRLEQTRNRQDAERDSEPEPADNDA